MKKKLLVLLFVLSLIVPMARAVTFSLGASSLIEGSSAGSDSVALLAGISWTATTNATWLHLGTGYQSGTGSTNVIFSFDANTGATRTGTFTIAGQTLTITQAGSTYSNITSVSTLVSSGLTSPEGIVLDAAGNVYIADFGNKAVKKWTMTNNTVTTLISAGLGGPAGLALDASGNIYIADGASNVVRKWTAANSNLTTLVSTGLSNPSGVAVDGTGNVYIADSGNNAIKKWAVSGGAVSTLVSSGLNFPTEVVLDVAGNVYIADFLNAAIKKWTAANGNVTTAVSSLSGPEGVAVDGAGNIYIADTFNNSIKVWVAASNVVTTLVSSGISQPLGLAADNAGNVYLADYGNNMVKKRMRAFVDMTAKSEGPSAGSDILSVVLPTTQDLLAPFAPTSDSAWLTISGVTNGVVTYAFAVNTNAPATNRTGHINLLGQSISVIQAMPTYLLGTTNLLEGSSAGSDSVVLAANYPWTASSNATWLHLSAGNQSGATSTNVVFTFDSNTGATRTGTLTIGGQTVTVTQAGAAYTAANSLTTLDSSASGLASPFGVAADPAGNIFVSDLGNNTVRKWSVISNTVSVVVNTVSSPVGMIFDPSTNLYIAGYGQTFGDTNNSLIKKLSATGVLTSLVSSGLNGPRDVAVDRAGNVYIADSANNAIKKWSVSDSTVSILVSSGAGDCRGVAVDRAGNVYFTDHSGGAIREWVAANSNIVTLVSSGLSNPDIVRVDGSGNVYIADFSNNAIKKWSAVNSNVTTVVSSGLSGPYGVALDPAGNIYIADELHSALKELPAAWVDATAKIETSGAGNDVLPAILPVSINLSAPFTPTSDATWLTISGVTNGVVSFAFTANTQALSRTAHLTLLGQSISVTQYGVGQLGTTNLLEASGSGSDSILLVADFLWTATANASWLHLSAANQSGTSSTNIIFSFDANSGATRTGTLTMVGYTVTVTQAGSSYVLADPVVPLVPYMTNNPQGTTVDGAGNVYYADLSNYRIKKWTAANNTVTTLISSGLNAPLGLATDGSGNLYIADSGNNAIKKWTATNSAVTTLVSSGLNDPFSVAVDSSGNVYIADYGNNAIKKWTVSNSNVTTLVSSGLISPEGVAVDIAGNVYIADYGNGLVKKWSVANSNVTTLVSAGLEPKSLAVDGGGNVYIIDDFLSQIVKWTPASNSLSTVFPGNNILMGYNLSADNAGNIYFGYGAAVNEQPRAFVDPTAKSVTTNSGSGSLPSVLPITANLTGPFLPTSDAVWLTISGVNNGVVSYAYPANAGTVRTAHISLLGQSIAITQSGVVAVAAPTLSGLQITGSGAFSFSFTNNQNASFTVWASTNIALPLTNWTALGAATNAGSGLYQFSETVSTNDKCRFYRVTSP